jgi:hypothetical protein
MRKRMLAVALLVAIVLVGCCPMKRVHCPMRSVCCARWMTMGKVRHVVLFKFKDGTKPEQIAAIEKAFRLLPAEIEEIRAFEWGTDMSVEKLADGFTHCFLVTFDDAQARDAYLPHPAHQDFVAQLKPILDKALVIDYVAKD